MSITVEQRKNVEIALWRWKSIPQKNVDLDTWRMTGRRTKERAEEPPTCKTIACFGGWLPWMPEFRAQGVVPGMFGSPEMEGYAFTSQIAFRLFGDRDIFAAPQCHLQDDFGLTDHELVTRRLEALLAF
jgi:hypothetical protein